MSRQALELALEALERSVATCFDQRSHDQVMGRPEHFVNQTITAIKEALAQPEQEPWSNVGIGVDVTKEGVSVVGIYKLSNDSSHLFYSQFYTTPSQRTWVGLTDEEIKQGESKEELGHGFIQGALWAEAKLREKNEN